MGKFKVLVDDNFHYMDESERYSVGTFDSEGAAVAKCCSIVERGLRHLHKEGMTAAELYDEYISFGKDPFIMGAEFSAWTFAKFRCEDICGKSRQD